MVLIAIMTTGQSNTSKKNKEAFLPQIQKKNWQFLADHALVLQLSKKVLALAKEKRLSVLRVWIAGCAPCEDAYAIGMFFSEQLAKAHPPLNLRIFATDKSEKNIDDARRGMFSSERLRDVPIKYQQIFFNSNTKDTQLKRSLRDSFVFAVHDYLTDPAFGKMDLVICRSQLGDLEPKLQQKALATFHYALNPQGILLLGAGEKPVFEKDNFKLLSKKYNYYEKLSVQHNGRSRSESRVLGNALAPAETLFLNRKENSPQHSDRMLLNQVAPVRLLADSRFNIIEFHGNTADYLEIPPGKATLKLLKLVKEEIFAPLHQALHELRSGTGASKNIVIHLKDGKSISIDIIALKNADADYYVLVFKTMLLPDAKKITPSSRVQELEQQLSLLRHEMDNITQEYENAADQLQQANEELMSNSEELQSLNEELETSKEELLKINEELVTANQQLYNHNEHLLVAREKIEQNSAMLRKLYMDSPALIATMLGPDHIYDLVNPHYQALFGSQCLEGNPLRKALPELKGEDLRKIVQSVYKTGKKILANELPMQVPGQKKSEGVSFFNFTFQPIHDSHQVISGVLCFGYEVTELVAARQLKEAVIQRQKLFADELERQVKERTASLRASNIQLEHSNKNLEQFASIASHDLQEPLRKIKTFTNILNIRFSSGFDDEVNSWIRKIGYSAERMSLLISEVLNFSRITNIASAYVETDLNDILDRVISDFDLLISEKNARVIRGKLPVIEAVPLQMNQLFYNLLGNALKFSEEGRPPKITVLSAIISETETRLHKDLDPALTYCKITVADNGIGFEQEFAEQIFHIFQRLHDNQAYEGTGIGLALCRKIAFNHRGWISAESNGRKGATFYILLPLKQPVDPKEF